MNKVTFEDILQRRISSTALKAAKESTRSLVHYYEKPKEKKDYFDFGNAMELYLIDQDAFEEKVAIFDDREFLADLMVEKPELKAPTSTSAYRNFKAEFMEANESKYIINYEGQDSFQTIKMLHKLASAHPWFTELTGEYQTPFEWTCPRTGLKRYARTDLYCNKRNIIIDIKTDAQGDFLRAANNADHFLQAFDQITGAIESGKMKEVVGYYWFVLTKKEPYFVDVYFMDPTKMLKVEESYWSTLMRLKDDLTSGRNIVWHQLDVQKINVPNYYK